MNMKTRGQPPETSSADELLEREQAFIDYVQTKMKEMQNYSRLGNDGQLTFFDLNRALMDHSNVNSTLNALYAIAKNEFKKLEDEYEDWYAEKYVEVKDLENPKTISPGKWSSSKEIEMIVRVKYKAEHKIRKHELNLKEAQLSFLRRTCESWERQSFILSSLSKNLQAEVASLHFEQGMRSDA